MYRLAPGGKACIESGRGDRSWIETFASPLPGRPISDIQRSNRSSRVNTRAVCPARGKGRDMQRRLGRIRWGTVVIAATTTPALSGSVAASPGKAPRKTEVKPYAGPVGGAYSVTPLLSVGDRVPETSH